MCWRTWNRYSVRADRMGITAANMELVLPRAQLNVAVTVSALRHAAEGLGYVLVFEDLSDLLRAQKQAAWREVGAACGRTKLRIR